MVKQGNYEALHAFKERFDIEHATAVTAGNDAMNEEDLAMDFMDALCDSLCQPFSSCHHLEDLEIQDHQRSDTAHGVHDWKRQGPSCSRQRLR